MCARKRIKLDPEITLDENKKKLIEDLHSDPKIRDYQRGFVQMSQSITQMIADFKDELFFRAKKQESKMTLEQELAELNRQEASNAQELERVLWMRSMNKAHSFISQESFEWVSALEKRVKESNSVIGKRKTEIFNALGEKKAPIKF